MDDDGGRGCCLEAVGAGVGQGCTVGLPLFPARLGAGTERERAREAAASPARPSFFFFFWYLTRKEEREKAAVPVVPVVPAGNMVL